MKLTRILAIVVVIILFFLGIIFAIASTYDMNRIFVAILFFAVGFVIIYSIRRKSEPPIQRLELSGKMKAVPLKCPNCSASVSTNRITIVSGVPFATCPYCDQTFEIIEEPKW